MALAAPRILIVDDQPDILESLRLLLKGEGYEIESARSPAAALALVQKQDFDVAVADLNYARDTTSGEEGLELISRLLALDRTLPIVVMTAWGSIDLAVEAMRRGARDFVQKPWENARLLVILRNQIDFARAVRRGERLQAQNELLAAEGDFTFIAEAQAMRPVRELIARVGPSEANVLILGEHGTGKEVVARELHGRSSRSRKPLVVVNVGGLGETVFESELFGHVKGAFTDAKADRVGRFELADGGTLFLDEIANVPPRQQTRLLRVIESREFERVGSSKTRRVDVRLISATNANLDEEVAAGRFREDLLFRLNTVEIRLPPLRARRQDIPLLADHFVRRYAGRYRKPVLGFDEAAAATLLDYSWPGNVRELNHVVERAVLMARGERIAAAELALREAPRPESAPAEMSLEDAERVRIRESLERAGGNVEAAARTLGLSRSALYRRIQKHGLGKV
jgi:DNA-binding NtrC family response regulator